MVEHVIGEWKQFTFKMIEPKDYPKILEHLRKVFYVEEPLNKMSDFGEKEYDALDEFVLSKLSQGDELSFYAEETKTGKIAGVRLIYKCTKDSGQSVQRRLEQNGSALPTILSPAKQKVVGFLDSVSSKASIFTKYGINYYADLLMTSVDPEFQRQGLVSEIYVRTLAMLRAKGYAACKSNFSSPYTRRVAEKLNFEELARVYFLDYKNEDGEQVFPNAEPDACAAAMAYRFL